MVLGYILTLVYDGIKFGIENNPCVRIIRFSFHPVTLSVIALSTGFIAIYLPFRALNNRRKKVSNILIIS